MEECYRRFGYYFCVSLKRPPRLLMTFVTSYM